MTCTYCTAAGFLGKHNPACPAANGATDEERLKRWQAGWESVATARSAPQRAYAAAEAPVRTYAAAEALRREDDATYRLGWTRRLTHAA